MYLRTTSLFICVASLSACGGGGGGDTPSVINASVDNSYTFTSTRDTRLLTTVGHLENLESAATSITAAVDSSALPSDSALSLGAYTLNNGVNSMSINTAGIAVGGLYSQTVGSRVAYVGGTTWNYSRFGYFSDKVSNTNNANTEYRVRMMPFVRANAYNTPTVTSATYNKSGKLVGAYVTNGARWATLTCDVSVAMAVDNGTQTADVSLANCKDAANAAITTTGTIRATKSSNASGWATTSNGSTPFVALSNGGTERFTPTTLSVFYRFGGPNAEELVGTVFLTGTTTAGTQSYTTYITAGFGAMK